MNNKMIDHKEKLVLITGGSSGIGLALGKELAKSGANVWLLARRQDLLDIALKEIKKQGIRENQHFGSISVDLTDHESVDKLLEQFCRDVGIPDLLINSAGVAHPGEFITLPIDIFYKMMSVNYFGTVHILKTIVPKMVARRSGHIVNISSIAGFLGIYGYTAYGSSKYAVRGLSDALRSELKPYHVDVSIIFPPDTDTPQLLYEDQFKPDITKYFGGARKPVSAKWVAKNSIQAIEKRRYIIIPGIENQLMFIMSNLLGRMIYPLIDLVVYDAKITSYKIRKKKRHNP
jgi:3-dehydrosphinganine reductase